MYVADCLYKGSEISISAKSLSVLKTVISAVGDERFDGDISVLGVEKIDGKHHEFVDEEYNNTEVDEIKLLLYKM